MGGPYEKLTHCEKMALDFFENRSSIKCLDLIIDIYDEIRCSEVEKKTIKQKFLRVLYNVKKSNSLYSLLGRDDRETLSLFLEKFLELKCDEKSCYIENESFAKLTLDELYNILIRVKYLKEKEIINQKRLSI